MLDLTEYKCMYVFIYLFIHSPIHSFIHFFREGGREGEREREREREGDIDVREKHQLVAKHMYPNWEPNLQPRHVP